ELYLVDDGSPDKSGAICDRYAADDLRIQVIHQENSGAAAARNAAIVRATGDYLYFMDGDDWCEPGMLSEMYKLADTHDAQYVVCGYYIDTYYGDKEDDFVRQEMAPESEVFYPTARSFRADAHKYFDRNLLYTPWNKLYRTDLVRENQIFFQDTQWDDFPFNLEVIKHAERIVVSPQKYYHFLRARSESESEKFIPGLYEKREEEHGWMLALYREWNRTTNPGIIKDARVREFVSRRYIERLIGCFENLTNPRAPEHGGRSVRRSMRQMLENPRVAITLHYTRPRSFYMKIMLWPLRYNWVWALYLQMKTISFVKTHFVRAFALLKANR
ncbi:MAG: glycosyltransferase family 2 protein, partial [Lachnospiraceae bacterium]|nr:glycosyltransferase family 2 protein [Lachnospiraceae bacterium]